MARNFCLLIAAAALLYGSEEFILWAKISTKNHTVAYDDIALLNLHKNELFECFLPYKFKVEDRFVQRNKTMNSATDLTLFPVRFTVKFKPSSAIISIFKNKE